MNEEIIELDTPLFSTRFSPITQYTVPQLIYVSFEIIFITAAAASFIFLLIGGVQWIMSGGDKEGIEKARKKITGALIGLAFVLSVYAIFYIISSIFLGGASLFDLKVPSI